MSQLHQSNQHALNEETLDSVMYASEVSLLMRKNAAGRKSRGGTSSQMFGRIHCNNISEAASFVYDTMPDVTVASNDNDVYISP